MHPEEPGLAWETHANITNFCKDKCKILHLAQGSPKQKYKLCGESLDSSPEEKDLGVSTDERFNMNWHCALAAQKANNIMG